MTIVRSWLASLFEHRILAWLEGSQLHTDPDPSRLPQFLRQLLQTRQTELIQELHTQLEEERRHRLELLARARFNVALLPNAQVPFDLSGDSWADQELAWIDRRTQALAARIDQPLDADAIMQRLFHQPHMALKGTGLSAKTAVCAVLRARSPQRQRNLVLHAGLSSHWQRPLLDHDFQLERLCNLSSGAELSATLASRLPRTCFVLVELLGTDHGSDPLPLEDLRRLRAQLPDVPLVLDATHLLANALLVNPSKQSQHESDLFAFARGYCKLANVVVASLSRGYALPFGGLVAAREASFIRSVVLESAGAARLSLVQQRMVAHALDDLPWLLNQTALRTRALNVLSAQLAGSALSVRQTDRALLLGGTDLDSAQGLAARLAHLFLATGIRALPVPAPKAEEPDAAEIALIMPLGFDPQHAQALGRRLRSWDPGLRLFLQKTGFDVDLQGLPQTCYKLARPGEELLAELRRAPSQPTPLAWLAAVSARPGSSEPEPAAAPELPTFPLSEGQRALYFIHLLAPDNNICGAFRLPDGADVDLIVAAFADLQQRHTILRTTFIHDGERPLQRVHPSLPVTLKKHRVEADPQALTDKILSLSRVAMDLEQGPLTQIHLLEGSSAGRHLLVLFHHLINDGASQPALLEDWTHFCQIRLGQVQPPRPELLPGGYGDFVVWQEHMLASEEGQAHLDYWRARLEPPPPALPLATDLPRPARQGFQGAIWELKLEPEFTDALKQACSDQYVSLFMFTLAAWQILVGRASRTNDVCIGSLNGSRPAHITRGEVGFYANVLPLRVSLAGNPRLDEFLDQVREVVFEAIEHADYPFNRLVTELGNPHIYQAGMVYQSWMNAQEGPSDNPFGLHLSNAHMVSFLATSQTDLGELTLELAEVENGLKLLLKYNVEVFTKARMAGLGRHLKHLLRQMIDHPQGHLDELELLDEQERALVLERFNHSARDYAAIPTDEALETWAQRTPHAAALYDHDNPRALWDYAQFAARVAGLASHLQALGVGPDRLVGICLERSPALVVALLAVQAAGGAYVPLDPSLPAERLDYMVKDADVALVLARRDGPLAASGATLVHTDAELIERLVGGRPQARPYHPERAAYMIYTSGSTGQPKGALNSHGAIINRLNWHQETFALQPGERVMQKTPFSFDVSVWEFFWPFRCGGALVVAAPETHRDPAALVALTAASQTQVMHFVPSMFQAFLEEPGLERLTSLRAVICSGEALSQNLQRLCFERLPGTALHNLYGPTEAAVDVSWWPCRADDPRGFVPIGAPIANTQLHVLDPGFRPLGIDLPGELCLGGVQLARGYHHRPALTAEKFVPNPLATSPGARLYRTGDLAAWTESGQVRFLGRLDFQVKLRGLRIELGELEAAINAVPGVSETVVLARKDPRGELCLIAYVQSPLPGETLTQTIRASLARQLPAYMVPAAVVVLERFPTSPNGKIERRRLPEPAWQSDSRVRTAPSSELERRLAQIWSDVLQLSELTPCLEDTFLDLGGHSLSATKLVARVRRELGCALNLQELFQYPTLGQLAGLLASRTGAVRASAPAAQSWPRLPRAGSGPLSAAQQRLMFIEKLEPGLIAYIISGAALIRGRLDTARLLQAFELIALRHETLRSGFREHGDGDQQFFPEHVTPALVRVDHSQLSESERQTALIELARKRATLPFDLSRPPLWRLALVRWSDVEHVLLLDIHHLIADFWSIGVLLAELGECYGALAEARDPYLAELPCQYVDFATWQQLPPQRERMALELAYWKQALTGVPALLNLPLDFARPARPSFRGALYPFALPQDSVQALRAFCRRLEITPYVGLLAVLQWMLRLVSGERDIVVGMPLANRELPEIQSLIGFFVNTLVQRTQFEPELERQSFEHLASQVGQRVREALQHQDVPFEQLVDALDLPRDQSHNPLYQVVFQLLDMPAEQYLGGLDWRLLHLDYGIARFDLGLNLLADGEAIHGWFEYSTDLFRPTTVARFAELFLHLLECLLEQPRQPLTAIETLPEGQRLRLLSWQGNPLTPREELFQTFLAQVAARPQATALACGQTRVDYASLRGQANQLAQLLERHGARPGDFVAIACDRGLLAVIAHLAIIELGAAYLPLDATYPVERSIAMLADSGARLILTADDHSYPSEYQVLRLDHLDLQTQRPLRRFPTPPPQAAAYMMYTSGSTGKPKGVVVPRLGIVRLVRQNHFCDFSPERVLLLIASLAFDAATVEIWGALLNGATLAILPGRSIEPLAGLLREHRVDTLALTAQLFHMVVDEDLECLAGCHQLLAGGEVLSLRHVRAYLERYPQHHLIHCYGPTENTTFTCCVDLEAAGLLPASAPLGPPIAGTSVFVVDPALRLCPLGAFGELVTGGAGLAWGYHRRPALTAEKFVPNPFADQPGERLYRTGDLARWLNHTEQPRLEFAGRIDRQIKLRGFRIELGEIEANLLALPGVTQALVVAHERTSLIAYLVANGSVDLADWRASLAQRLPDYMIPAHFMVLPAFPVNANGKIDRRLLPLPTADAPARASRPPANPLEEILVGIWAELLGQPQATVDTDFFNAGGNSLLAARVAARVRRHLDLAVPLRVLFENPTPAGLAEWLRNRTSSHDPRPALSATADPSAPLSYAQARLWFVQQLEPASGAYNIPLPLRLTGPLCVATLREVLGQLLARHESLRTRIAVIGEEPCQLVDPPGPPRLQLVDLSQLGEAARAAAAERLLAKEVARPFDLTRGPLMRCLLLRQTSVQHLLILNVHHIISDGRSMDILMLELGRLYAGLAEGRPPQLSELALQYRDFARWQRAWPLDWLDERLRFWVEMLAGAPPLLTLPADFSRPHRSAQAGALHRFALPPQLLQVLDRHCQQTGATRYMVLLGIYAAVLSRYADQRELCIGTPVAQREFVALERVVGFFANTLALRLSLPGEADLHQLTAHVRGVVLAALEHQDTPFDFLVERLAPKRLPGVHPLFQTSFSLETVRPGLVEPGVAVGPLRVTLVEPEGQPAKFDCGLYLYQEGELLYGRLAYSAELYRPATMAAIAQTYVYLVEQWLERPDCALAELAWLDPTTRAMVLEAWNPGPRPYPREATIQSLVASWVQRQPEALALLYEQETRSWRQWWEASAGLAQALRQRGLRPGAFVAVALPRSLGLMEAILAIAQVGGVYQPIDANQPGERQRFMLAETGVQLLITHRASTVRVPGQEPLFIEDARPPAPRFDFYPGCGDDLAYIVYTSGSTGRPKGVAATHRGVVRLVHDVQYIDLSRGERTLFASTIGFDAAVLDMWSSLLNGGSLAILPTGAIDRLGYYLSAYQVTTTFMTTQLFQVLVDEDLGAFAGMRQLLVGGEALSAAHAKRFLEAHPGVAFYNVYGPTENGVLTSAVDLRRVPMLANGAPLGTAIDRSTLYVVDQRLQLLPLGAYGELVTGGDGLAQGYFQRPALTAEKFVPNPFAGVPGARMYRTGDLVRWVRLEQGPVFEFAGRIDRQVKLRGFRIEIGEIEHAIGRLTGVAQALVLLSHAHGDARLIAYAVPHAGFQLQPERLLSELAQRLPPYMMPSALVVLEQFPMNANGKIDRARLPEPSGAAANVEDALTPRQAWLRDLWQELLGAESIGLKDNFFILGGHSLLATRLVARVRARLGVALSLHEVFTYSDLDAMAAVIERASAATSNEAPALMAESQCALSFSQQRLWFLDQLTPGDPTYHIALRLRWRGDLDVVRLERALYLLVERHEALRTAFPATAEGPSQRIEAPVSPPVGLCDLSLLDEAEQARLLAELAGRVARAPFALERAPLFRWTLVRGAAGEHRLLFTLHHIIADGWSLQILMREWVEAYDALGRGQLPSWPALPLRYRDYALRQRAELVGEALRERESFWSAYLAAPLPSLDMPTDWPRPSLQSSAGALLTLPFPPALEQALGTFRRQGGATVYQILLAALVALLRRHSGQGEFLVATPVANRPQAELEGLVGFFVNTLIVRVAVGEGDSFDRLVAQTVASCQAAFAHQDFPFERLVALLQPERDLSRAPLAQVMFQVLEQDSFEAATPARLEFWDPLENPAQLDLSFAVRGQEEGYKLYLTYATALFSAASARRLATRFLDLAAALLAQPQLPVDRVALIDPAERALLQAFNATGDAFDQSATIHGLFVAQARRRPTAIAVTHGLTRLDYKTLLARAQANAARLRAHGVVREQPVGVCLQRNEDLIVALLAVLLAGGAYVPIDPAYPEQRKRHMLEDSGARVVLTDPRERANLPDTLERLTVSHENLDNLADAGCLPDQLAYIIYTSGSTGRPKGVAIRHLNACALCHWSQRAFSEAEMAVVLASTSVCFDLSVFEIFATLARGCRAVVVENLLHLVEAPAADEITLINTVPSAMTELLRLGVPESVTTVNLAGEPFQASLIQALYGLPHVKAVHNLYGPSEDTTYSTGTLLPRDLSGTASIGGPILNTQLHLLDRFGAPVPYGVAGEIHLGGLGLARGYHRRPALTAEKFVPDPFGASPGGRLYRTGDLARFRVDGALLFLGRLDHQVKIRGFRIELGEIEARISALPVVEMSLVTHHQDARGSVQLVAYVQPRKGLAPPTEERLLRYLESQLPEYMVPNAIVFLDFPLTPNGKIDRQRLPAPALAGMAVPPPSTMQTIASLQGEILRAPLAEGDRRRMLELLQQLANPAERASADALEAQLLQIWREVLGLVHIDRHDNFFKLGGHSLLAVRVLAQIAAQLGVRLPLVSFFQATTVSQLAELVRRQVGGGDQFLQCLRAEGRRPPLYLVHPAGGGLLGYHALVQALVDRPVYGFVAQGFEGQGQPLEDFEAMAQRYVEELLAHQPQGPHLLAGWSLGGVLASAMVARLQALGQPTLPPLLFDAHAPLPRFKQAFDGSEAQCMGYFLFDLAGQAGVALAADAAQLELLRREDARQAGYRWAQRHGLLGDDLSEREFNRLYAVFRANLLALLAYHPSPRPDTVLLFKAQASARDQGDQLGWEQLFASVRIHEVPGDHFSLLTAPILEHWISLLEHCLAQLQHHSGFE